MEVKTETQSKPLVFWYPVQIWGSLVYFEGEEEEQRIQFWSGATGVGHGEASIARGADMDRFSLVGTWHCGGKGVEAVMDSSLGDGFQDERERVVKLALLCTHSLPINKPSIIEVVKVLRGGGFPEPET